jgi:hypothetical protein
MAGQAASGVSGRAHGYGSGTIPCAPRGNFAKGPLRDVQMHGNEFGRQVAAAALAETADCERERPGIRTAEAALRLAQGNPRAALAALAPLLDSTCTTSLAPTAAWRPSTGPVLSACSRPSRNGP